MIVVSPASIPQIDKTDSEMEKEIEQGKLAGMSRLPGFSV
jgi:hypothetical protein